MQHKRLRCKCSGALFYIYIYIHTYVCMYVCLHAGIADVSARLTSAFCCNIVFRALWSGHYAAAILICPSIRSATEICCLFCSVVVFFFFVPRALCKWKRQIACGNLSLSEGGWRGQAGAGECILSLGLIAKRIKARVKRALFKQQILGSHWQAAPNWQAMPPRTCTYIHIWMYACMQVVMAVFVCVCICLVGCWNASVCVYVCVCARSWLCARAWNALRCTRVLQALANGLMVSHLHLHLHSSAMHSAFRFAALRVACWTSGRAAQRRWRRPANQMRRRFTSCK